MNVDGTGLTQLTTDPNGALNPVMAPDGSNQTRVSAGGMNSWANPHRSPDSGETVRTFRASLNVLGDGFVEATEDSTFLAIRDAQPPDMRGTAIFNPTLEAPNEQRFSRFSWKGSVASLPSFSAGAYLLEMGITNPLQPAEQTSLGRSVAAFDPVPDTKTAAARWASARTLRLSRASCARTLQVPQVPVTGFDEEHAGGGPARPPLFIIGLLRATAQAGIKARLLD